MSDPQFPQDYYNRFDESEHYEQHVFLAGKVLQSAEQNEIQSAINTRLKGICEALFKDGDVIQNAQIIVNPSSGETTCQAGVIYLLGAMRGVVPKTMTIPVSGTVRVGVRLVKSIATYLEDPGLRDPAIGIRNYQEIGAARLKYEITWAWDGDNGTGDFYPIYIVNGGYVENKEPPPNIDALSLAIARYDRQSTGGHYISEGLSVTMLADDGANQVYSIQEGLARIYGHLVVVPTAMRVLYAATPDLLHNVSEPHTCAGGSETITLNKTPVKAITSITITKEVTETVTRGTTANTSDILDHGSVVSVSLVTQSPHGAYSSGSEYILDGDTINWSPGGDEPATGSDYSVTYRYEDTLTGPFTFDDNSVDISGAVAGTVGHFWYDSAIPRYDKLCLTETGEIRWVKGVAAQTNQIMPSVPTSMLGLATIYQSWTSAGRTIAVDGTRMVPMHEIEGLHYNIIDLYDLVAENQLAIDVVGRITGAKKGLFADSFRDNGYRDSGQTQDLIVSDQTLQLDIPSTIHTPTAVNTSPVTMSHTHAAILTQDSRTSAMQINPYQTFEQIAAKIKLNPSVDNAVSMTTLWAPSVITIIRDFRGRFSPIDTSTVTSIGTRDRTISNLALRQIQVDFNLQGFGSGEQLTQVKFDGIDITSSVD